MKRAAALLAALFSLAAAPAPSQAPLEPPPDARTEALFREVRCVVCQNESIAESQADLAADLRGVVREQVAAGRTDDEVRAYLAERYGEFVLFRPAFSPGNALLWLAPFAVVLLGGTVLLLRPRRVEAPAPLNGDEAARLRTLADLPGSEPDERNVT
jgi:cytochrome c-type biogenesis protein CcmH